MPRRRAGRARWWVGRTATAALAAVVLLLTYGTLVEPRLILDQQTLDVALPRLPEGAEATVAVFSDLQIGMWGANTAMIERAVDEVVDRHPTAAVVAGDLIYGETPDPAAQAAEVAELLEPLPRAGIPTFVVFGNHDHAVDAVGDLTEELTERDVVVLRNESVALARPAQDVAPLHLVGLGAHVPGRTDVDAALAGVPEDAPRLVVMHNPVSFLALPPGSAPLAGAGHTHCGQIAVPGLPI